MVPKFVLIHAKKNHGKTTMANLIEAELANVGIRCRQLVLADAIRDMVMRTFDLPFEVLEDQAIKNKPHPALFGATPRSVMQLFGTEFAQKAFGKDIWCKILYEEALKTPNHYIIIPDVRFEHEVEFFKRDMHTMIFLEREGASDEYENETHSSEAGLMHMYDEISPKMVRIDLTREATIEGTRHWVKNFLIDFMFEERVGEYD